MESTLTIVGAFLGFIAFIWRIVDEFGSFLRISVTSTNERRNFFSATASLQNSGFRAKKVDFAFLLVGPEAEQPVTTANKLAAHHHLNHQSQFTNDFVSFKPLLADLPIFDHKGRALIPLPFFYSENIDVADETLSYTAPIPAAQMKKGTPCSVRFFVFSKRRLHRSTQALFLP